MDGLIEYHLDDRFGIQVFAEVERAGRSSMVLDETDLDDLAKRLTDAGIQNPGPQEVTDSRILPLEDPDGNRVLFTGT